MPKHWTVTLTAEQRAELEDRRDHDPLPYIRERAAALLKVADGSKAAHVAATGLYRPRKRDTIYRWLLSYQHDGLQGLRIKSGRGRKPAFFPETPAGRNGQRGVAAYGASGPA